MKPSSSKSEVRTKGGTALDGKGKSIQQQQIDIGQRPNLELKSVGECCCKIPYYLSIQKKRIGDLIAGLREQSSYVQKREFSCKTRFVLELSRVHEQCARIVAACVFILKTPCTVAH